MSPKKRSPGDGGLWKRADGMWTGSVEIGDDEGGRKQRRVYSKNRNEARKKLDKLKADLKDGLIVAPRGDTTITGAASTNTWLRYWADRIKKPKVKPNTYDFYDEAIRLHIAPFIGTKRLDTLTAQDVRWMLARVNTPGNARRAHTTLKMALKAAVKERIISRNVAEAVDRPGHIERSRGSLGADAAKAAILAAIALQTSHDETAPLLATRWAAAFLTGARPAELLGLEWDRVDLTNGVVDLSWQLQPLNQEHGCGEPDGDGNYPCGRAKPGFCTQRRWNFNPDFEYRECHRSLVWTRPKTVSGRRIVPLVAPLQLMLEEHRDDPDTGPNPYNLVWHHRIGRLGKPDGRPISRHDDAASWRAVLAAAKLPTVEVYAIRHSTATLLQELGVPEEVRMQIMGQSSAAAHRGYIHVDQTQTRAALGKLERLLLLPS